ncbi:hypothetical protein QBZ16_005221 [Prototheca wickerhamii]|uniref:Proteasome activator Blm10 middle HEAT repeats region domain-containing protein n=1 Tax=Prototheca wickerhamii TaxID=3111 RepID=A0AAD9IG32_PROWI|nr:hypothetical protein QBZ16_005221 [Prototheca wickerhamii]
MSKSIYNHWLPEPLAEQVATEEPRRYAALVASLKEQWERDRRRLPLPEAVRATQGFLAPCRTFYHARADLPPASLLDLVRTQLSIVLLGEGDLMVQTRWALQAQQLLRTHRSKLRGLRVAWRPWLLTLRRAVLRDAARDYEGSALSEARRQTLARLAHRLRRHWPRGAAAEIWAALRPALLDAQRPAAYEALGWLVMLLPTTALRAGDGDWGAWAREWARLWGEQAHCAYWDALWGALFARLAAHDAFGLVDWRALAPALLSRYAWAFRVPVGASFADPPLSFDSPRHCQVLFANELQNRAECAAHAAVYMIGHVAGGDGVSEEQARSGGLNGVDGSFQKKSPPQDPAASPYGDLLKPAQTDDDPALALLERLVAVLEQYYHPSNGGRWTPGLAHFLRALTGAFAGRVLSESRQRRRAALREAAVGGARGPRRAAAPARRRRGRERGGRAGGGRRGHGGGGRGGGRAVRGRGRGRRGLGVGQQRGGGGAADAARRPAPRAAVRARHRARRGAAPAPGREGPVWQGPRAAARRDARAGPAGRDRAGADARGRARALLRGAGDGREHARPGRRDPEPDALRAAHAAGGPAPARRGRRRRAPPPRAAAGAALAAALVATLPAIDANDPSKSLAAFRFYAVALSSLAGLPVSGCWACVFCV